MGGTCGKSAQKLDYVKNTNSSFNARKLLVRGLKGAWKERPFPHYLWPDGATFAFSLPHWNFSPTRTFVGRLT